MPELVRYEVADRIATLTLNRPERLNAISPALDDELLALMDRAVATSEVHAIVVQGAGRAFSAGADSKRDEDSGMPVPTSVPADRDGRAANIARYHRIWDLALPVIAKVHGYCFGRASQLVIACDLAYAAEDAVFGTPRLRLGAGFNSVYWAWELGPKRAKELFLPSATQISGRRAAELGIVNAAVPAEDLDAHVAAYARKLARTPRELLTLQKRAINRTQELKGMKPALEQSVEVNAIAHQSESVRAINRTIAEYGLKAAIEAQAE